MLTINYNRKDMWELFKKEFLNKGWKISEIAKELNINKGTIGRWILKEEVPPQYFNDFNRLLGNAYKLNVSKEENYKIMDQFFTPEEVAKEMIDKSLDFIKDNWDININEYTLIEPSAGAGAFYKNFPSNMKKVGLDIDPQIDEIQKMDWFKFIPNSKNNIVIGNPPFGLRGQLALKFINKAAEHSDFICFVLPPLFNSNGKGSPMLRINKDFYLAKEFEIKDKLFNYPSGKKIQVYSIFQIWTKKFSEKIKPVLPPQKKSEWIKIYSLSDGGTSSSRRNIKMIDKCDFYLPSTTFQSVKPEINFRKLANNRGYGIVILKEKEKISKMFEEMDWEKVSFKSTNGANNLRTQLIIDAIEERMQ